ncbi:MAG: phosphonate metabolism protein/1,5-bisphosphokinase (PRPP-forming) PhnN [Alphaproteobacteria bacterium]
MSNRSRRAPDVPPETCDCPANCPGTLFLVVGPSGAGKDTLMDGARAILSACPRFRFARRVITRGAAAGGEDHDAVTPEEFSDLEAAGAFCLSWSAHGLSYGVPAGAARDIAAGRHVVVNVSRRVIGEAQARFSPLETILVTASRDVLAQRLAARGREDAETIAGRLARTVEGPPDGPGVHVVRNEGPVSDGIAAFLDALRMGAPACRVLGDGQRTF